MYCIVRLGHLFVMYSIVELSNVPYSPPILRLLSTTVCAKAINCTARLRSVQYCPPLNLTVLYRTVLYCTLLYCTVLYCVPRQCAIMYHTAPNYKLRNKYYCTVLYAYGAPRQPLNVLNAKLYVSGKHCMPK